MPQPADNLPAEARSVAAEARSVAAEARSVEPEPQHDFPSPALPLNSRSLLTFLVSKSQPVLPSPPYQSSVHHHGNKCSILIYSLQQLQLSSC